MEEAIIKGNSNNKSTPQQLGSGNTETSSPTKASGFNFRQVKRQTDASNARKSKFNYNGELVAKFTLEYTKQFRRGDCRPINMKPKLGVTKFDCSGWVGFCINVHNPELFKKLNLGPTSNIIYFANRHGGISKRIPEVGDLALWTGHVEIVVSVQGKSFSTSGSSGKDGSKIPTTKFFKDCKDENLRKYNGTFLGFWTPTM